MKKHLAPTANMPEVFETASKTPTLSIDTAYYQTFLDDIDIDDDQKRELIETLWTIIVQFVDLGFGVHPLQTAERVSATSDNPDAVGEQLKLAIQQFAEQTSLADEHKGQGQLSE